MATSNFTIIEDLVESSVERAMRVAKRLVSKEGPAPVNASLDPRYHEWFLRHRASAEELQEQQAHEDDFDTVFSIIVPLFHTPIDVFGEMLASVEAQSYGKWQLVLVNATPEDAELGDIVARKVESDDRITVVELEGNYGITANTNVGVAAATGDYVCFFDHDDLLEPNVLFEYAKAIAANPETGLLYCDEDKLGEDGCYVEPHFKPDFNIDLLCTNNYVCHLLCVKRALLDKVGPNDPKYDGAQDHALTLHISELTDAIVHVPKVLYHWRITAGSTASKDAVGKNEKSYANEAGRMAIQDHLDRVGLVGTCVPHRLGWPFCHEVEYPVVGNPLVSVVITGGSIQETRSCARSLKLHSTYDNLQIILLDPDVTRCTGYAAWANEVASHAIGEYILFIDAGLRCVPEMSKDPVGKMLGQCQRSDVGAVGGLVLQADNTVYQAGMVSCGPGCVPESVNSGLPFFNAGYGNYGAFARDYSFVSSCCMMMHRGTFEGVGGFNESFARSFYGADLCLKLNVAEYRVVYEPRAVFRLSHRRAKQLCSDLQDELAGIDGALLLATWPRFFEGCDPQFNPNLNTPLFEIRHGQESKTKAC